MEELAKDNKEMQKVMTSLREMSEDEYERALAGIQPGVFMRFLSFGRGR